MNQYQQVLRNPTDRNIRSLVERHPKLVTLSLVVDNQVSLDPLRSLTTLRFIDLGGGPFEMDRLPILPSLETLRLIKCEVKNLDAYLCRLSENSSCRLETLWVRDFESTLDYRLPTVRTLTVGGDGRHSTVSVAARFTGLVKLHLMDMTIQNFESLRCLHSLEMLTMSKSRLLNFQGIEYCHNLISVGFNDSYCDVADDYLDPPRILNQEERRALPWLDRADRSYRESRYISDEQALMYENLFWFPIAHELRGTVFPAGLLGVINTGVLHQGKPNLGLQYHPE